MEGSRSFKEYAVSKFDNEIFNEISSISPTTRTGQSAALQR